jgi:hypothetical protein
VTALEIVPRRVQLVIVDVKRTPIDITTFLGVDPDYETWAGQVSAGSRRRPPTDNSWELRESGDSAMDVSELLRRILIRLLPIKDEIIALKNDGCRVIMSLILYLSSSDPVGSGFVLSEEFVKFLADVGVVLEVDQYVEG